MKRPRIIVLFASLVFAVISIVAVSVLLANWTISSNTVLTPGDSDIRGKWRPDTAQGCSEGRFIAIGDTQMSFIGGQPREQVLLEVDVVIFKVPQADGPVLVLHPWKQAPEISILLHTDLSGGELNFTAAEWSEAANASLGDQSNDRFTIRDFLGNLQRGGPYHRCP